MDKKVMAGAGVMAIIGGTALGITFFSGTSSTFYLILQTILVLLMTASPFAPYLFGLKLGGRVSFSMKRFLFFSLCFCIPVFLLVLTCPCCCGDVMFGHLLWVVFFSPVYLLVYLIRESSILILVALIYPFVLTWLLMKYDRYWVKNKTHGNGS